MNEINTRRNEAINFFARAKEQLIDNSVLSNEV